MWRKLLEECFSAFFRIWDPFLGSKSAVASNLPCRMTRAPETFEEERHIASISLGVGFTVGEYNHIVSSSFVKLEVGL